jgi:D-alanyl-D-alanine carboxypeptidase
MSALTDLVPVSSIASLNKNLSSASEGTMKEVLGKPATPLTTSCQNSHASMAVKALQETRKVAPHVKVTGIKPALDSLQDVLNRVAAQHPDLINVLGTEGMLCVRLRKPTSGAPSTKVSNHAWGTAIDFKLVGQSAPGNTGSKVPRWVALLVPFFNAAGWFSGIDFKDDMHFEVADETIRKWQEEGRLVPAALVANVAHPVQAGASPAKA